MTRLGGSELICFLPMLLRYAADLRSLLFVALLITLFALQYTGVVRHWTLIPITAFVALIVCIIKHNHIHCRTFVSKRWNRAFECILSLCTGQSIAAIIPVHNERHHGQYHSDEDYVRSSLVNFRNNCLNLLLFPFAVVRLVHRNKHKDFARWQSDRPGLVRKLRQEQLLVSSAILILLLCDWRSTLLYLGIPWIFAHWAIVAVNLLQHQDCEHGSEFDHSRNVTGSLLNWFFLNNGFHTAHHIKPALHWSQLPEYHRRFVEPYMKAELNDGSLLLAVWKRLFRREKA